MSQVSKQSLIALVLLGVTALLTLALTQRDVLLGQTQAAQGYEFVADIDMWQRSDQERAVHSPFDFRLGPGLDQIPMQIGEWKGITVTETNQEVFILLKPEQMVYRRYDLPDGRYLWLSVLGSRGARTFHDAEICYTADGWKVNQDSVKIPLASGDLTALKIRADKAPWTHVALYFYVFPNPSRDPNDGTVLVKVTAPLFGTEQATLDMTRDFMRQFFTSARA